MSYAAVGQNYPEIPLVDDYDDVLTTPSRYSETPMTSPSGALSAPTTPAVTPTAATASAAAAAAAARSRTTQSSQHPSRRSVAPEPELQPTRPERSRSSSRRRAAARTLEPPSTAGADPMAFRQTSMHDTDYRVRGGGIKHKRTPVITILLAVVVIAALAAAGYFLTNFVRAFVAEGPEANVITLTTVDTRSAIDAEMPVITTWMAASPDDTFANFQETGWNVFINERFTSDNPDNTNYGKEIIHLSANGTEETLSGYYESEFNAYDFDELQRDFNGAWMLDLTQGDMGYYAQLKYINLNSEGLEFEIQHLLSLQGLSGDTTIIDDAGTDKFDNTYSIGYTVIDETTYYWKAVGIALDDYYQGRDRRSLPETAVFLKLTISTFDFYGAGSQESTEG
jgi:hypothetical protein